MLTEKTRSKAFWTILFPLLLVALTLIFGASGFKDHHLPGQKVSWFEAILKAAGLPLLETTMELVPGAPVPWTLQLGRILGVCVPPYAFILVLLAAFREPYKQFKVSLWRYHPGLKHAVVCGLGWKGYELVRDLVRHDWMVAVIEPNPENPFVDDLADPNVVVLTDDATSQAVLRRARVSEAEKIYVVSGKDEMNCRIVNQLVAIVPEEDSPPECYVDVEKWSLRHYLAQWAAKISNFPLTCFNLEESTARGILRDHPIDRFEKNDPREVAHATIIGSSPMARALLIQALRIGHLQPDKCLEIDLLVENAQAYREALCREMPCLHPDWGAPGSPERRVRDYALPGIVLTELPDSDSELLDDECRIYHGLRDDHVPSLFVCIDDGYESAALVGRIMDKLEHLCDGTETDLHVGCYYNYPEDPEKELTKVLDERSGDCVRFFDFGSYDEECTVETVEGRHLDALAREIALFYDARYGQAPPSGADLAECLRHFEKLWHDSDQWSKESNRQAADHLDVKLRSVNLRSEEARRGSFRFNKQQKEQLARMEHKRWCAERLLAGWRPLVRTPTNIRKWDKDKQAYKDQKLHIDLVPFDDLPADEQDKDYGQIEDIPRALREATDHRPK